MICFCYFYQKIFFPILSVAQNHPFSVQIGPKNNLYQLFFRTAGLQHKLLTLIVSPNIFHWKSAKKVNWVWSLGQNLGQISSNVVKKNKETCISMAFFHILQEVYIY